MNETLILRIQGGSAATSSRILFGNFFADVIDQAQTAANESRQTQVIYISDGLCFTDWNNFHNNLQNKPQLIAQIYPVE